MAFESWWISWDDYLKIVAVVGGLASVIGILGLVFSPLENVKSNLLKDLARTTEEFEIKQEKLEEASQQITQLKLKKEELKALVEKASLSLYYNGELKRMYGQLDDVINKNKEIKEMMTNIWKMEKDATALNCEIEKNDEIKEIISTIQKANEKTERKLKFSDFILSFLGNQIIVRI